jgi:hypothetical protein
MTKIEEEIVQNILRSEHWEDNLSGLKWSPKLKDVVMLKHQMEIREWRSNEDLTLLKNKKTSSYAELIELSKNLQQRLIESSCAAVLRSSSDFRIKEIGFNKLDDLFLNNWGTFLSYLIQPPTAQIGGYTLYDTTNTARTNVQSAYSNGFNYSNPAGFQIQFGSGTTAAARTNYAIQSAFTTAPEKNPFGCGNATYANGNISFGNLVTAGGSGTINEIGLFGYFYWPYSNQYLFMLTHDILGAGVAFVGGNPLVGTFAIGT